MVTKITVGITAVKLPFGKADRPVIQNLGPGEVYFGSNALVDDTNGIKLSVDMGYEFPNTLTNIGGWDEVWVIATVVDTDVRIANVG